MHFFTVYSGFTEKLVSYSETTHIFTSYSMKIKNQMSNSKFPIFKVLSNLKVILTTPCPMHSQRMSLVEKIKLNICDSSVSSSLLMRPATQLS